jgi:hypothetical protein
VVSCDGGALVPGARKATRSETGEPQLRQLLQFKCADKETEDFNMKGVLEGAHLFSVKNQKTLIIMQAKCRACACRALDVPGKTTAHYFCAPREQRAFKLLRLRTEKLCHTPLFLLAAVFLLAARRAFHRPHLRTFLSFFS